MLCYGGDSFFLTDLECATHFTRNKLPFALKRQAPEVAESGFSVRSDLYLVGLLMTEAGAPLSADGANLRDSLCRSDPTATSVSRCSPQPSLVFCRVNFGTDCIFNLPERLLSPSFSVYQNSACTSGYPEFEMGRRGRVCLGCCSRRGIRDREACV